MQVLHNVQLATICNFQPHCIQCIHTLDIHTYTFTCICMHMHVCDIHTSVHAYIAIHAYIHTFVHICIYIS